MRPRNPHEERQHQLQQARDCLLRAAAATLDGSGVDALALAELWAGRALIHMVKADPAGAARERAVQVLEQIRDEKASAPAWRAPWPR